MRNERRWCVHFKSVTFLERLWGDSQPQFFKEALTSVLVNFWIYLVGDATFRKFHLEAADLLFAIKHAEQSRRNGAWLFVCVCVCVSVLRHSCTCFLGYAEWLSCSQRGLRQHLAVSCEPRGGVSTTIRCRGKHVLHHCTLSLSCYKHPGRPGSVQRSSAMLAFMSFLYPVLGPRGSTWDRCCSHPLGLIATPHSLPKTCLSLYQITCLSLLTSIFLPIAIHCSSLVHNIMFTRSAFHFFISNIRYRLPFPTPPISLCNDRTNAFIEDCVLLHCHFANSPLLQKSITHQIKR